MPLGIFRVAKHAQPCLERPSFVPRKVRDGIAKRHVSQQETWNWESKNSPFHEYELFDITSQPEYEANIFAAHLLLDDDEVARLAKDNRTDVEIAGMLNVNINLLIFKMNEMNRYGANYNLDRKSTRLNSSHL